ncbi:MAG: endonuclease/exonuclease/phosphatase family protein, partial [Anaerolineae bacterium]
DGDMTYEPVNGDFYLYMRGIAYYTFSEYKLEPRDDADIRLKATSPALGKSAPSLVAPGELFTYTLTVNNDLGFPLNDLVITDVVPADTTFAYALDGGVEDGGVVSWTVSSLANLSSVSVSFVVTATNSPTVILNDDYVVVASNFVTPTAGASVGTVVSSGPLRIRDIQGAGHLSPLNGQLVQDVRGIVTLIAGNGFYIQDPDADSDLATSEGILVFGSSAGVSVGDDVLVDGTVSEFYNAGSAGLSTTRINLQGSPTISSTGNALPAPVVIGVGGRMPPTEVIDDDAGGGSVETSGTFDPQTDGIDFYESLEGMLVQINDPLAIGPTEDDAIPVVGDGGAYATFMAGRNGVTAGIVIRKGDFNPERVIVANPNVSSPPDVNVGDHLTGPITGTIDYDDVQTYGNFYLVNATPLSATSGGLAPETTTLTATESYLTVASFNVYNLDPGDTQYKFDKLADQIVNNLGAPDIVGLEEIQDNNGEVDDGTVDASLTYSTLITAILNAGGPTYVYADIAPENNQDGGAPGGNIRVGFLYRPDRVTLVQRGVATATTATTPMIGATGVELTYSPGRIDPTNPAVAESRKSLAAEFIFNKQKVFVIVNHFNSKSGDDPLFGNVQPPVFASEAERIGIAQMTNDFVDDILALDPCANVIVLGDLNDFHFSEAVSDVLAADALTNLMFTLPITDRYTYVFEGNSQVLDQILISDGLVNFAQPEFDVVHVNAEFVADITNSSRRASDHDPVVARFWLPYRYYMPMIMHSSDSSGDASLFGTVQPPVLASETKPIGIAQMPSGFHLSKAVSGLPTADTLTNLIYSIPITIAILVCLRATRRSRITMPLIARSD